eukprot:11893713-Prorocentrum_lima.AAC.1
MWHDSASQVPPSPEPSVVPLLHEKVAVLEMPTVSAHQKQQHWHGKCNYWKPKQTLLHMNGK